MGPLRDGRVVIALTVAGGLLRLLGVAGPAGAFQDVLARALDSGYARRLEEPGLAGVRRAGVIAWGMFVAQISDFHVAVPGSRIDRDHHTSAQLERAVARLGRLEPRPDLVLCTGDLVQDGEATEYRRLVELLEPLPMPYYVIPGNHDHREALRAAFAGRGYLPAQGLLNYVVDAGPLRLLALDTLVPGKPGGVVGAAQLAWLDARLSEASERPTIVFMHHPPFRTGIVAMDAMGLDDAAALAAVVRRHPQVERVLCGHLHRSIVTRFAGTIASTAPSTGPQLALDLRPDGRAVFGGEPPAFLLHAWDGQRLLSHLLHVAAEDAAG